MRVFLRPPRQAKLPLSPPLLPASGQNHRPAFRPNRAGVRFLCPGPLSRSPAPHRLSRSQNRPAAGLPDQQFHRAGADHRPTLSGPLADRIVLQMAQATSAHQSFLRHQSERGAHPNLDRHRRLSARRHLEKTSASEFKPLHYSTDFEPDALRENVHFTGLCSTAAHIPINQPAKSSMFTGFLSRTLLMLKLGGLAGNCTRTSAVRDRRTAGYATRPVFALCATTRQTLACRAEAGGEG